MKTKLFVVLARALALCTLGFFADVSPGCSSSKRSPGKTASLHTVTYQLPL
ncbi:MAG TPA: hypothetical protein VHM91_22675 [Verrucomicrobiales bacterium]|nr:hypothetical protein [Verrucomicrobiales bacterium]